MDFPRCKSCDKRGDRHDVKKGYSSLIRYKENGTASVSKEFVCSNDHVWYEEDEWKCKKVK